MKSLLMSMTIILLFITGCDNEENNTLAEDTNINIYELQTKNIEHLLVCIDSTFSITTESANSKQSKANTLVALMNLNTAQMLIVNDQNTTTLGKEQRLELTKISKRLQVVHEDLQYRFTALGLQSAKKE
jgi:hypothetical protein